jgi:hypothetical protein
MTMILETEIWDELENAAWGVLDNTAAGRRLQVALMTAMRERELVIASRPRGEDRCQTCDEALCTIDDELVCLNCPLYVPA